jgi:hypothetical protein
VKPQATHFNYLLHQTVLWQGHNTKYKHLLNFQQTSKIPASKAKTKLSLFQSLNETVFFCQNTQQYNITSASLANRISSWYCISRCSMAAFSRSAASRNCFSLASLFRSICRLSWVKSEVKIL